MPTWKYEHQISDVYLQNIFKTESTNFLVQVDTLFLRPTTCIIPWDSEKSYLISLISTVVKN